MAFRLPRRAPAHRAAHRLLQEQLRKAIGHLDGAPPVSAKSVHESRKCLKRARAVISLVESALPKRGRPLDRALRDVSRSLSARRDADALRESFEWFAERDTGRRTALFAAIRQALADWAEVHARRSAPPHQAARRIEPVLKTWQAVELPADDWDLLEPNLRRAYRRGRREIGRLGVGSAADDWHRLRKLAKQTQYHLELLGACEPRRIPAEEAAFEALTDLLGRHHDLTVLSDIVRAFPDDRVAEKDRRLVLRRLQRRLEKLEARACRLGPQVYAERPRDFLRRLAAYWTAWRARPVRQRRSRPKQPR